MIILPYVKYFGPKWFRRMLLDMWPESRVQRLKNLVDLIDHRMREIFNEKKAAVVRGDEAQMQQMVEGKDVTSILRM